VSYIAFCSFRCLMSDTRRLKVFGYLRCNWSQARCDIGELSFLDQQQISPVRSYMYLPAQVAPHYSRHQVVSEQSERDRSEQQHAALLIHPTNHIAVVNTCYQWLKCNGAQGNAVPPPPIYGSKRSPTSDCYNARERHTTVVRGPNLNVAFPHL